MPKLLDASWDPPFSRKNCQSKMSALIHRARRRCTPEVFMGYCRASLTKVMAIPRLEAASVIRILRMGTSTATGLLAGWIEAGFEPVGSKRLRRWRMGGIGCAVSAPAGIRFGAHNGLKSDIAPCPKCAPEADISHTHNLK